jgi:hypothetical protein
VLGTEFQEVKVGSRVNKAECVSALLGGEHGGVFLEGGDGMRDSVTVLDVFWVNKRRMSPHVLGY